MDTTTGTKIAIGLAVMLAWGGMVLLGQTEAQPFVDALKEILMALGVYHVVKKGNL